MLRLFLFVTVFLLLSSPMRALAQGDSAQQGSAERPNPLLPEPENDDDYDVAFPAPPVTFEWDGDVYNGKPRDWLVNRSPAVLHPSQVPAPLETEVLVDESL